MGHSTCTAVSKLASFCAPYLVLSNRVSLVGIGCILGAMNLLAAGCAMLLPETLYGTYWSPPYYTNWHHSVYIHDVSPLENVLVTGRGR